MSEIRIVTPLSNKSTSAKHDRQLGSSYFIRTNGRFDPIKTRVLDQNQVIFIWFFGGDQNTRDILINFICFFLGWSNPSSHDQQPTPHSQKKGHIDRLSPCSVKDTWARSWGSDKMGSNKKGQSKLLDLRFKNWESTWNPLGIHLESHLESTLESHLVRTSTLQNTSFIRPFQVPSAPPGSSCCRARPWSPGNPAATSGAFRFVDGYPAW
jgi:hypothetical protein